MYWFGTDQNNIKEKFMEQVYTTNIKFWMWEQIIINKKEKTLIKRNKVYYTQNVQFFYKNLFRMTIS